MRIVSAGASRPVGIALVALLVLAPHVLESQVEQYRSLDGVSYHAHPDTGEVARTALAYLTSPTVANALALGAAQSRIRRYRDAIETYADALSRAPHDAQLLRWRGHRFLTLRDFGRAQRDLRLSTQRDSTLYGAWYHLGITHFALNEYPEAVGAFAKALPLAPDAAERAGSADWLWMSLMNARRPDEAAALLARRPDSIAVSNAYARRLALYRGEIAPEAVVTAADTGDVQLSTLAFGVGHWYRLQGDSTRAFEWFQRSVAAGGWPGFGFIIAESSLDERRRAARLGGNVEACREEAEVAGRLTSHTAYFRVLEEDDDLPRPFRALTRAMDDVLRRAAGDVGRDLARGAGTSAAADPLGWRDLGGTVRLIVSRDGRARAEATREIPEDRRNTHAAVRRIADAANRIIAAEPALLRWPAGAPRDSLTVEGSITTLIPSSDDAKSLLRRQRSRVSIELLTLVAPEERPVQTIPETGSPTYPEAMRRAGISGEVVLRFVVDTMGVVDLTSVRELFRADAEMRRRTSAESYPNFRLAVMMWLPNARYRPATIGGCKLRQLIQQPYVFALQR